MEKFTSFEAILFGNYRSGEVSSSYEGEGGGGEISGEGRGRKPHANVPPLSLPSSDGRERGERGKGEGLLLL